jgi:serine/threonine protein phosphatase PrpC
MDWQARRQRRRDGTSGSSTFRRTPGTGDIVSNPTPLSLSHVIRLGLGTACGLTDVGTVRSTNQDNFVVAPLLGLLAVADGMGGHAAGDIASADALHLLCETIAAVRNAPAEAAPDATWTGATANPMITLLDAVRYANDRLYQANVAQGQAEGSGMGTTLTGIWQPSAGAPLLVFHVGDSRAYCWRAGELLQLTRDQTLYQQALDLAMPGPLPPRNLLLQAMGPAAEVQPELVAHAAAPGDVYLLCSDGLYGESSVEAIAAVLARARDDNLDDCCAELIALAKRDGSRDNITALLLRCHD